MGRKRSHSVLLNKRKKRQLRRDLLFFMDLLNLYLSVGYDLSYAWPETHRLCTEKSLWMLRWLPKDGSLNDWLRGLEKTFPIESHRFVFGTLQQLYARGAPLTPAVKAFAHFLRKEFERDLEKHLRDCPVRANLCLMLFFLPPTLALLFLPLLNYLKGLFIGFN